MKKIVSLVLVVLFVLTLSACSSKETGTEKEALVRLVVRFDEDIVDEKVTVKAGDTAMSVLKANYKVSETKGFITAIDGVKENKKQQKYWMYNLNGKLTPKAADQQPVKDGDELTFYQKVFTD